MRGAEPCEGERSSAGPPSGIHKAHPSLPGPPKPPGSRGSADSLLSEGRGSSALARPQLPPVPPGRAVPRLQSHSHKPAAAATDAVAATVGAKEPHGPQYARNGAAFSQAPPPPPSPPPPHGPLLTKGGGGRASDMRAEEGASRRVWFGATAPERRQLRAPFRSRNTS